MTDEERRLRKNERQRAYARRTNYAAQKEYNKTRGKLIRFYAFTPQDDDILRRLDSLPNKSGYLKALIRTDIAHDILPRTINDIDGNIKPEFKALYADANGDIKAFAEALIRTNDKDLKLTQAYAVASEQADDGGHRERLKSMLGDRVRKVYSDAGSVKIGNDSFNLLIPHGSGDGVARYAVVNKAEFNDNMARFFARVNGKIDIYLTDTSDDIAETIDGSFDIYTYEGFVIFCTKAM